MRLLWKRRSMRLSTSCANPNKSFTGCFSLAGGRRRTTRRPTRRPNESRIPFHLCRFTLGRVCRCGDATAPGDRAPKSTRKESKGVRSASEFEETPSRLQNFVGDRRRCRRTSKKYCNPCLAIILYPVVIEKVERLFERASRLRWHYTKYQSFDEEVNTA